MKRLSLCLLITSLLLTACTSPAAPRVTVSPPGSTFAPTVQPTKQPMATQPVPTDPAPTTSAPTVPAPTTAPTVTPRPQPTEASVNPAATALTLQPLVSDLTRPTYLTHAGDDRLFVVEQPGRIRVIENGQLLDRPFLDIVDRVMSNGNEQGLLSVAFHPDYASNGQFFVNYTRQEDGATMIERYTVSAADANTADRGSAAEVIVIKQPEPNHNGGQVKFGPDGYLYIGTGDGGGGGDRHGSIGNGQDPKALLGKMLRIDVTNQATYAIPPSNPFGNEVWALGVRNPWRFSFDRATGDLYMADVGQNQYEEVNFQPASSLGGENYGWRIMEAAHCFDPRQGCDQSGLVLPVAEYDHGEGCSVTGGYVYRGRQFPGLQGQYFFADYCTGTIWSLQREASGVWQRAERLNPDVRISSFGEDVNGELYVIDHGGAVYRLIAN